jgi:cytochrome bd-type quinol oxidase subunit 2
MTDRAVRNACRRLVLELVVVVLLAGIPVDFPRHVATGHAWDFLVRHPSLLAHVVIGTVVLAEACVLMVRMVGDSRRRLQVLAGLGLLFSVVAVAGGVVYVSARQGDAALSWMTIGWLGAVVTFAVGWWLGRRALRREAGTGTA